MVILCSLMLMKEMRFRIAAAILSAVLLSLGTAQLTAHATTVHVGARS